MPRTLSALTLAGLLTALALAVAPPATAAHTCPYRAEGHATRDGVVYNATLDWTGQIIGCGGEAGNWFYIEIRTAAGAVVANESFAGVAQEYVHEQDECGETIDPYVATGASLQGFYIEGYQRIDFCRWVVEMHYEGFYGLYALDLDVWSPL